MFHHSCLLSKHNPYWEIFEDSIAHLVYLQGAGLTYSGEITNSELRINVLLILTLTLWIFFFNQQNLLLLKANTMPLCKNKYVNK